MNVQNSKKIGTHLGSILCVLALVASAPSSAEGLTDIYQQALENDHEFKAAQANLGAGLEFKKLGRAALLPNIGGSASWSQSDIDNTLTTTEDESKTTEYGVGLTQALINVSAWHNYSRGKALASTAQVQFTIAEQELILRTAESYLTALKSVDDANTAKAEENALSHQLEQTKQRFEVGLTAITEVHEAQAAYDSATASRLIADGGLGISFESLEVLTGRTHEALFPLKRDFAVLPPQPAARKAWVDLALANNAPLQATLLNSQAAEANAKAKKSEHFPTLSGGLNYGNQDSTFNDDPFSDQSSTNIQLNLNVPLYAGGSISASRRQAAYEHVSAKEQHLQAQREVILAARSTHLTVITAAATVKARAQAITSNTSALEATQAGYDVGTRDLVDVLNAQRFLYRAQRDFFDALYAYILATLKLKQTAGILVPQDLYDLDKSLDTSRTVVYKR